MPVEFDGWFAAWVMLGILPRPGPTAEREAAVRLLAPRLAVRSAPHGTVITLSDDRKRVLVRDPTDAEVATVLAARMAEGT